MRSPRIGKPRAASGAFSLSRNLPSLQRPLATTGVRTARPHPRVGRPQRSVAAVLTRK